MTTDRLRPDPSDPDPGPPDALNAALDGAVGEPSPEVTDLLAVARLVEATPLAVDETASTAQMDAMWDEITRASSPRPSTAPSSQAVAFQAMGPISIGSGARGGRGRSGLRTVGSWLSMAAVAAVLIATASMAWSLRPGGGDGHLLASATSLAVGSAYASPSPVATDGGGWLRWPDPADCDAVPMSLDDYATIMQTQPDISGRSYEVAGVPAQADADAAANVARRQYACTMFSDRERQRTLSSPAFTFFQSYSAARTMTDEQLSENRIADSMLLSITIPKLTPSAYSVAMPAEPPAALWDIRLSISMSYRDGLAVLAFDPGKASLLADGRIAIPGTYLTWSSMEASPAGTPVPQTWFSTSLVILDKSETGAWLVDETSLIYCPYQQCGEVWENVSRLWQVPVPTLDVPGPLPWTIPTGTATPVASPASRETATPKP